MKNKTLQRRAHSLRFLETFAGIGGFGLPLTELGHECVGFSEIDKYATQIYQARFPNHQPFGDITTIAEKSLPAFDLLVGGFPCPAFSVAGKRRGFADARGKIFFDLARILQAKKPRIFIFENVKGLLSHDGGRTFATIIATLAELGYDLQWQVLNSKDFGVPQNRERVFIVGHLGGTPRPEIFPLGEGDGESLTPRHNAGQGVANALRAKSGGPDLEETWISYPGVIDHGSFRQTEDAAQCIDANYWKGPDNHGQRTVIQDIRGVQKSQNGKGHKNDGTSYTIETFATQGVIDGSRIRRLTPLECERLQGYPDGWTGGISDTQRYKCLGNAVTVNVVRAVVSRLHA